MGVDIFGIIGTAISSCAALVSCGIMAWQLHASREHNKLSYKPVLASHSNKNVQDEQLLNYSLAINNFGSGSAMIDSAYVIDQKGNRYEFGSDSLRMIVEHLIPGANVHFNAMPFGILPHSSESVIQFICPISPEKKLHIDSVLAGFSLLIQYKSVYGEDFTLEESASEVMEN